MQVGAQFMHTNTHQKQQQQQILWNFIFEFKK